MTNPRGGWTLFKRETLRFLTLPNQTILPSIITTILYITVFGFFLGPRVEMIEGFDYIVFIFPGILLMNVGQASFQNASISLFISKWERFIDDLLVAPISYTQMVMAYIFASALRGLITGFVVFLVGILMTPTPVQHPFLLVASLTLTSFAFSASGLIVGLWAERWDNVAILQNFIVTPLTFLGGVFYSTSMLPQGREWLNELNPIFYMVSAVRYSMLGRADEAVFTSLLVTLVFAVAFFLWVLQLFRKGYKLRS